MSKDTNTDKDMLKREQDAPEKPKPTPAKTRDPLEGSPDPVKKLVHMARAFPKDTPDEQVLCGYGNIKMTVGDFRALAGMANSDDSDD